jgi:hypothetical protein
MINNRSVFVYIVPVPKSMATKKSTEQNQKRKYNL